MQADRYHLTPLAPLPGSAIVTRTKLAEESSRKGQKDFVLLLMLVSFRPIQINITVEIYDCFFYDGNLFMMVFFYYGNLFLY